MSLLRENTPPSIPPRIIGQKAYCGIRHESYVSVHAFEHLLRLNRVNSLAFFLSGFAHTFKNPINSIQLASELLIGYTQDINALFDELNDEPDLLPADFRRECCNILTTMPQVMQGVSDSAFRLNQLVSHLSAFTGRAGIAASHDVDLNRLISLCAAMTHHQICVYTNSFRLDLETDLPILPGNAQQILQVILNLLINALLSLPKRSCAVVISTSSDRATGYVQMSVLDEGTGIPTDDFPSILEPFFSSWQEHGCLGLGLTVADQIIRNHGGKLTIDSEYGKGTTVLVALPAQYNGV